MKLMTYFLNCRVFPTQHVSSDLAWSHSKLGPLFFTVKACHDFLSPAQDFLYLVPSFWCGPVSLFPYSHFHQDFGYVVLFGNFSFFKLEPSQPGYEKLVLLGHSHLLLQADRTSADVSSSSWLLTPIWELHARNLSKAAHTFPETLKKKKKKHTAVPYSKASARIHQRYKDPRIILHSPKQIPQLILLQNWLCAPSSAIGVLVSLPRQLRVQELFEPLTSFHNLNLGSRMAEEQIPQMIGKSNSNQLSSFSFYGRSRGMFRVV